ncbi:YfhO family protein [Candidatus Gottesmanbacteria bacterium]|nr:YfhO family protein [Candidatus Gottesmanbacteria bacterium]
MKQIFTFLNNHQWIGVVSFFCLVIFIVFFPITKGLIALPLDLLVASYKPWYSPGTILLKNPYMQDTVTQMFPWKHYLFTSLQEGIIPFWNPYQFGGAPFMGNLKSMVFYPLHVVYFLGEIRGWHVFLMLQLFLSLSFSYLFIKEITKSTLAGIFSSLAFSFNSLMIGVLYFGSEGHVLLWLPLMLWTSKKYIDSRNVLFIAILSSALAMSILAGQLQYVAYECLMIGVFSFWYAGSFKTFSLVKDIVPIVLGMFVGVLASAIQLVPSISVFLHSYRGATDSHIVFARGLLQWWQVFRLVSQDLFGNPVTKDLLVGYIETSGYFGLIPLFFSVFAMVYLWKKNVYVRIFTVLFISGIVLSLHGTGEIIFFLRIPLLSSAEGGRVFVLALFSGSFLAGIGFSEWLRGEQKEWKKFMFAFAVFLLCSYAIGFSQYHSVGSISQFVKHILIPFGIFSVFYISTFFSKKLRISKALFIIFSIFMLFLTFFDFYRNTYRFLTFSNSKFLYPDIGVTKFLHASLSNTLARTHGLTEPEISSYLRIPSVETYDPLYSLRTARLLNALQGIDDSSLQINKYRIIPGRPETKSVYDFMGVSYIVVSTGVNPSMELFASVDKQTDFDLLYSDIQYMVYQNKAAFKRFGLYESYWISSSDAEALYLVSQNASVGRDDIVLEERLPVDVHKGEGVAKLREYKENDMTFDIDTKTPKLFYLSDTYDPGWKAYIDGHEAKIYRANYNYRAVLVPAGVSVLHFEYVPKNFIYGVYASFAGVVCILFIGGIGFVQWRMKK